MMKKYYIIIVSVLMVLVLNSCGLPGFRFSDKDKKFHSTLSENFKDTKVDKIGVFVFSNGSPIIGMPKSDFTGFRFLYEPGLGINSKTAKDFYIDRYDFPNKIKTNSIFNPDSSNSGPSLELAGKVVNILKEKGYSAKEVSDLGHNENINCDDVIEKGAKLGLDAVFVVYYTGVKKWYKYVSTDVSYGYQVKILTTNANSYSGYLYLPNAALISTKTKEILWSTQYYGLVQNAHFFNVSGQYYNQVAMDALYEYGDESYIDAAGKAADMIFKPKYWKKSFIEFPGSLQKKLKI